MFYLEKQTDHQESYTAKSRWRLSFHLKVAEAVDHVKEEYES